MLDAIAEYRPGSNRHDLRRQAWAMIGTVAELAASVREHADGDTIMFEVVTGIPGNGHFATHGHALRLTLRAADTPIIQARCIATSSFAALRSVLACPIHVGAVLDGHDRDGAKIVVNAVNHPVVAAAGAVQSGKAELQRLAGPARVLGK